MLRNRGFEVEDLSDGHEVPAHPQEVEHSVGVVDPTASTVIEKPFTRVRLLRHMFKLRKPTRAWAVS